MDGYLGEIKMFAGNYVPANWVSCSGQLLSIMQYQSLYAIIGIQFGGDGVNNFRVPDLRGRVAVGAGAGPGLTNRIPGQMSGYERVTLSEAQIPQHTHTVKCDMTSGTRDLSSDPQNNLPAKMSTGASYGSNETGNPLMKNDMITSAGAGQSHENMPPWTCIQYIMCAVGNWPPRD